MLYVNDEPIKEGTPQWEKFADFKKNVLPNLKNPVIFKNTDPIKFNDNGLPEPLRGHSLPLQYNIGGEFGSEDWRYCKRAPRKEGNGKLKYFDQSRILKQYWSFDKAREPDAIFFLMEIAPFLKKGIMILEDKQRDARREISKEAGELDVKFMIISEHSPISVESTGSEDLLRMVSAAWGIADAESPDKSIEEIKLALIAAVNSSEKNKNVTKRGYAEFLKEINSKELLVLRANLQKALDNKTVSYDAPTFSWRYVKNNYPIMTIPASAASDPEVALYNFLVKNNNAAVAFKHAMDNPYSLGEEEPKEDKEEIVLSPNRSIDKATIAELRAMAKEKGINSFGKKKEQLIAELS